MRKPPSSAKPQRPIAPSPNECETRQRRPNESQQTSPASRIPKHAGHGRRTTDFKDATVMKPKCPPSAVNSPAPTGRKKSAQGKERSDAALGHTPQNTPSPEGATQGGQLPKGWRRVAIKDMADSIQYGHTASAVARKNGPRFLRITDIQDGRVDWNEVPSCDIPEADIPKYRLSSGDLVFARTGATTGKSFLLGECPEAVFASYLIRVRVTGDVDSRYLSAFFQSPDYWRQIESGKRGIGQPNVNGQVLGDVQFPLPPLPEQRRIVAEIEKQFTRLDAGVAALRRVQANLKRYRAAVLKAACEGRLVPTEAELHRQRVGRVPSPGVGSLKAKGKTASTETISTDTPFETGEALLARILTERRKNWQGRGQYKEPSRPDPASLQEIPDGWTWASVEQLLREPLCNGVSVKGSDNPPGVPALRLSAMSSAGFDYSDARYLPLVESEVDDLWIQEGDFFMSRGNGSLHLVGRGTCAQKPTKPTIFPDTMIRLRLADDLQRSGWIRAIWPSHIVRSQIEARVKTTAGIYKIAQPQVEGMIIPLPPLPEQLRIVAEVERRLSVVEELESVVTANLQRARRLQQSILYKAFTGELS
jgi:type I restriction enzyme S subunit